MSLRLPERADMGSMGAVYAFPEWEPRVLVHSSWESSITLGAGVMRIDLVTSEQLDRLAAQRFYAVPHVEEVRREDAPGSVIYHIWGNNLSEEALEQLVEIEIDLSHHHSDRPVMMRISDRFDRPILPNLQRERLRLVHNTYRAANTSTAGYR